MFVGTMLSSMFSGRHELVKDSDGNFFIDRDPELFKIILNYLRALVSGSSDIFLNDPKLRDNPYFQEELNYFGLTPVVLNRMYDSSNILSDEHLDLLREWFGEVLDQEWFLSYSDYDKSLDLDKFRLHTRGRPVMIFIQDSENRIYGIFDNEGFKEKHDVSFSSSSSHESDDETNSELTLHYPRYVFRVNVNPKLWSSDNFGLNSGSLILSHGFTTGYAIMVTIPNKLKYFNYENFFKRGETIAIGKTYKRLEVFSM
eukprot:TRINITY_DN232_c0_g2_i1.p1 TRINITY_DN232_c0_g2~~TRINITY_DN232_c0_g2_i1.p1  ORF type:complete len:257 (+),score=49.54 TRINITY_DN232_c0_g2_i1:414-1184(+)